MCVCVNPNGDDIMHHIHSSVLLTANLLHISELSTSSPSPPSSIQTLQAEFSLTDPSDKYSKHWLENVSTTLPSEKYVPPPVQTHVPYRWNSVRSAMLLEVARRLRLHRE